MIKKHTLVVLLVAAIFEGTLNIRLPTVRSQTTCPPLTHYDIMLLQCELQGQSTACQPPYQVGTKASMRCDDGFILNTTSKPAGVATCDASGAWTIPASRCVADCGKVISHGAHPLVYGETTHLGEFPWHIVIYASNALSPLGATHPLGTYDMTAAGTLITHKKVLAAAIIFFDHRTATVRDASYYKVAAGKYHRNFSTSDTYAQVRDVKSITLHPSFKGFLTHLSGDIAVLEVKESFVLNFAVNLVCLDLGKVFEETQLRAGNNGSLTVWSKEPTNDQSNTPTVIQLPYMSREDCHDAVSPSAREYLTADKFCVGWTKRVNGICEGDAPTGIVFPQTTERGARYYLRGIGSVSLRKSDYYGNCDNEIPASFTLVSYHSEWVGGQIL